MSDMNRALASHAMNEPPTVLVEVTNSYDCGRVSRSQETVPEPAPGMTLEDWFNEVVFDVTGDGHPCGVTDNALYVATVIEAADATLIGQRREWGG